MEKRQYGNSDMQVSVLGFGGAEIGFENAPLKDVEVLLGSALDAGLNLIDTAECYSISEELIGKAISHRRDDYYLFTKCGHASGFDLPDWDPRLIELSIDRSLRRLKTVYLDVVHLHSCSEEILRRGEVIEVLQRAKDKGKIRYIGYSGDHKAALYAVQCGMFDSLQTSLNIADQEAITMTIPEAIQRGIGVVVKRPIANIAWKNGRNSGNSCQEAYWERLQTLDYDFLNGDLQNAVDIALRFALFTPGIHSAVVGTKNPNRWAENEKLIKKGPLSDELYQAIRKRWAAVASKEWIGLQ